MLDEKMIKKSSLDKISTILERYDIKAKKALSQNFIFDLNLTEKIVHSMGNIHDHDILEIGPGPGGLTRSLLSLGARRVIAIEKDKQFIKPLEEISVSYPGRLKIINDDILSIEPELFLNPPVKIVSNLPYNIGTQILLKFINSESWPPFWDSLTLMFQKEVAERIISKSNTRTYGRLSIISQWRSNIDYLFTVSSKSFTPIPAIDSAVLKFTPRSQPFFITNKEKLESVVKQAFNQRRKMLRQSLKLKNIDIQKLLASININSTCRPQELTIKQFCMLANAIDAGSTET